MKLQSPFVSRKSYDALLEKNVEQATKIRDRDRQLSRMGHTVRQIKEDHANLLESLRLVRTRIEYPRPHSGIIGFSFEMSETVFDSYRRDDNFVELMAYMIKGYMMQQPEGRKLLAGWLT